MFGIDGSESELAEADWNVHRPVNNVTGDFDNDLVKFNILLIMLSSKVEYRSL